MTGLDEQIKAENKKHYSGVDYACQLEKWNTLDAAKFIREKEYVTQEEYLRLVELINSPDRENYELAKIIIVNQRQHLQHDSYIQTGESQLPQY